MRCPSSDLRFPSSGPGKWGDGVLCVVLATAQLLLTSLVVQAGGPHLFPFRTESLSRPAPMILLPQGSGTVGHRRDYVKRRREAPFCFVFTDTFDLCNRE